MVMLGPSDLALAVIDWLAESSIVGVLRTMLSGSTSRIDSPQTSRRPSSAWRMMCCVAWTTAVP